jgi:hypothetical protein
MNLRKRSLQIGIGWLVLMALSVGILHDASGAIRVGGGLGLIDGELTPFGRMVLDILPLLLVTFSLDFEYWVFSANSQQLLPFVTVSMPLIFKASVGFAPILTISTQGVSLIAGTLAIKGNIGALIGPLELFMETILLASPAQQGLLDGPFLAAGVTLGF